MKIYCEQFIQNYIPLYEELKKNPITYKQFKDGCSSIIKEHIDYSKEIMVLSQKITQNSTLEEISDIKKQIRELIERAEKNKMTRDRLQKKLLFSYFHRDYNDDSFSLISK